MPTLGGQNFEILFFQLGHLKSIQVKKKLDLFSIEFGVHK